MLGILFMAQQKNLEDIAALVAESDDLQSKAAARRTVKMVFDIILSELKVKGAVNIAGLGKFITKEVPERTHRSPANGQSVVKPAHTRVVFKVSKANKNLVTA